MWPFYVYRFDDGDRDAYIGKGVCSRFAVQKKRMPHLTGYIVAYFKKENDALRFERELIKEYKPFLNKTKGGDGCKRSYAIGRQGEYQTEPARPEAAAKVLVKYLGWLPAYGFTKSEIGKTRKLAA